MLEEVYRRIAAHADNPVFIHVVPQETALAAARRARGPLAGQPFAVKDNIDVAGLPTTAACPGFAYVAKRTAPAAQKLLDAGAVLIGKTNLDQFATGLVGTRSPYGVCRNAFDPAYISGGSSSGSALAVALGMARFALGTDTAGSGRVPAAFNNLVGLKPTRGLVSTAGVVPACRSLDCVSVLALTADDAQQVYEVARGFDAKDSYSREGLQRSLPRTGFRFGMLSPAQCEFFGDAEAARLYRRAAERLAGLGGEPVAFDFSPFREAAGLLYSGPW